MSKLTDACRHVIVGLLSGRNLHKLKTEASSKFGLSAVPTNLEILAAASPDERKTLLPMLRRKPIRTISGVSVVAVMTSPEKCPHGKCIMCPGGPSSHFGNVPQSYTGREPASMRAVQNDFDPYRQVKNRLEQLTGIGHPVDKIELIIQGGTFTSRERKYQEWFVQRCLDAMNGADSPDLEAAVSMNDLMSNVKNIGTTIETRPDCFGEKEIGLALGYGATRVELGLQSIYDDVLGKIGRGHSVRDSVEAIRRSKEAGLKVVLHVMPFLPGSNGERDFEMFRQLFTNPDFMPDELKIYPTQVIAGTRLHEMTLAGEYAPPTEGELVELLSRVKKELVPEFVRIKRILRDIPATVIEAGTKKTNLRQLLSKGCKCIRCREIGHKAYKLVGLKPDFSKAELRLIEYDASGGREVFLNFVEPECDAIIGLLRLRLSKTGATVRELHVFGSEVALGLDAAGLEVQHMGFGKRLMEEAETLTKSRGFGEIRVISGIGVRQYYRKLGYALEGAYMLKHFK